MVKLVCIRHWFIRVVIAAVLASVTVSAAEPTSFISTLSAENKAASGVERLSEEQIAALNAQIAREIAVARQGATVAFATSFTHRRTPQQRTEAGLDRLMTPELARLDTLVATAVANGAKPASPATDALVTTSSPSTYVESIPRHAEVHGEVTLAYVSGSGGAHGYGASMVTTVTDPSGKYSLTFGFSQFYGKGFHHYPGEYPCDRGW
jgi:hypothetical protein